MILLIRLEEDFSGSATLVDILDTALGELLNLTGAEDVIKRLLHVISTTFIHIYPLIGVFL